LIDSTSGEGWYVGDRWPRLFAVGGDFVVGAIDEPHPTVVIYSIKRGSYAPETES
jgi:hypothetical protein